MEKESICFIICVNDEYLYKNCLNHINKLIVPKDIEIEVIDIREAISMCNAYNASLCVTKAKYKVYLHQDTFIINRNFISDIITFFRHNPDFGMLGVIGAKDIPPSGVWWEASVRIGKVIEYRETFEYLTFDVPKGELQQVKAIDGLLMATQYDVTWRQDIFDGWHLYDTSQCYEFYNLGYKVGVVNQNEPWILHYCGNEFNNNEYQKQLQRFKDYYL
ncbi:glycosyltransferase family protein [Paenibacillus urinalis]|uniref:glycosyltransferase family protein n=1 Tax=Paenibacillus urinalis TaxID=521520 RepID=UPI00195FE1CF